jgi:dodecin
MAKVVKVIELMSESSKSWEDAAQNAIREASRTLRNIRSLYVKEMTAAVENGRVTSYRLNTKVTLELEGDRGSGGGKKK